MVMGTPWKSYPPFPLSEILLYGSLVAFFLLISMFLSFLALRLFLLHTTGSDIARKKSIRVEFMQDDHGMICAHTCAKLVILPRGSVH